MGLQAAARPGYFNDLDFLQIGFKALSDQEANRPLLSDAQYRTEFSVFCLLAAPLIMSNDLSRWTPAMATTLLNPEMIAIDQDPKGTLHGLCSLLVTRCVRCPVLPSHTVGCVGERYCVFVCWSLISIRLADTVCYIRGLGGRQASRGALSSTRAWGASSLARATAGFLSTTSARTKR